jgi:hypothetical protein
LAASRAADRSRLGALSGFPASVPGGAGKSSAAAELRLWRIGAAVLRCSNQIAIKQEATWQAKDEVVHLPERNGRADVPPMAISVDRWAKNAAPSCALANTHSWP